MVVFNSMFYDSQAHTSMKQERDSYIKKIFTKHNFGPVPEFPFASDVAVNLTNRIRTRLSSLENDLQQKKVSALFKIAFHLCLSNRSHN